MVTKFKRAEFATACNIANNTLTIMAKRGKLAINSARCAACEKKQKPCNNCRELEYIDLEYRTNEGFYINLDFYNKNVKGIAPVKIQKASAPGKVKEKPKPEISVMKVVSRGTETEEDEDDLEFSDLSENSSDVKLDKAAKYASILDKQAGTRIKELQEAKMRGDMIPLDIVKNIIQFLGENQKRAFSDAIESVVMLVVERLQAQEHDKAFIRSRVLDITNKAINQSVNESQTKLDQFIPNELQNNPS